MCNSLGLFIPCTAQVQAPGLGEKMVGREEEAFLGFDNTQYTPKVQAAGLGEERERERVRRVCVNSWGLLYYAQQRGPVGWAGGEEGGKGGGNLPGL